MIARRQQITGFDRFERHESRKLKEVFHFPGNDMRRRALALACAAFVFCAGSGSTGAQSPNGSWNDDPYQTALAMRALLATTPLPAPAINRRRPQALDRTVLRRQTASAAGAGNEASAEGVADPAEVLAALAVAARNRRNRSTGGSFCAWTPKPAT